MLRKMVEYLAQALRQTSREATVLLYAPALDPHLQKPTELANPGVLHLRRARLRPKPGRPRRRCRPGAQRTLEAYSWGGPGGGGSDRAHAGCGQSIDLFLT